MAVDKSKDTNILSVLHSATAAGKLAHADEIFLDGYADNNATGAVTADDSVESAIKKLDTKNYYTLPIATKDELGGVKSQDIDTDDNGYDRGAKVEYKVHVDGAGLMTIQVPKAVGGDNAIPGIVSMSDKKKLDKLGNLGTTDDRPTLADTDAGYQYYDTDLKQPIWWDGTRWTDALGVDVATTAKYLMTDLPANKA